MDLTNVMRLTDIPEDSKALMYTSLYFLIFLLNDSEKTSWTPSEIWCKQFEVETR